MVKRGALKIVCLLLICMHAPAFRGSESHGGEVEPQEGLALLESGLNWSGYLSQDNFIPPINRITTQDRSQIAGESLKGDSLTGPIVALHSIKNGKYINVDMRKITLDRELYVDSTSITDSGKPYLITVEDCVALKNVQTGEYVVAHAAPVYFWIPL
jgi:hypothetical protein